MAIGLFLDSRDSPLFSSRLRVVVVLASGSALRSVIGMCLALFFVECTKDYQPYIKGTTNALAYAASWQIFFTFVAAFFLLTEPISFSPHDLSAILLTANLGVFVYAIAQQGQVARREFETQKLRAKVHTHTNAYAQDLHANSWPPVS